MYSLSFYDSFHGRSYGSLSLTASKSVHRKGFGPFGPVIHAPYAYCYRCPFKLEYPSCGMACVDYIKNFPLSKEVDPKEVASIFVEPVQGEGGYIVPPKEFMQGLREICDDNGMLLVSDEVQAGYMRTGKFLALDNFGVTADIYTMAKGIGGGLPLGATITKSGLGDVPRSAHSNTFGGNLLSVAAANASLKYLKRGYASLSSMAVQKGNRIMKRLNEMKNAYEIIGDVRGIGMMIGIEFVKNRKTKEPAVKERDEILGRCFNNGLLLLPSGTSVIRIAPPITIGDAALDSGLDILEDAIREIGRE